MLGRRTLFTLLAAAGLAAAGPAAGPDTTVANAAEFGTEPRAVDATPLPPATHQGVRELNPTAFAEAQRIDLTATYAFAAAWIRTGDDRCLGVDMLSGDDRANLTPILVLQCSRMRRQRWDIITAGRHIAGQGNMLVVSDLTHACFNVDRRGPAGNRVFLFSCGGRADGSGEVTDSQYFAYDAERDDTGPLRLRPGNSPGMCLTAGPEVVDIAPCIEGASNQTFRFEMH